MTAQLKNRIAPLLSREQMERYSRQILLEEIGLAGQRRLLESRVLVVGAGGLGSPSSLYLAAAGVGTIGIVDGDRVELNNLHRQIVHTTRDVGIPKTQSAGRTLLDLNPDVSVLPPPLPGQRRLRLPEEAVGGRQHPEVGGAGHDLLAGAGVLPLPLSHAAAAGRRPLLRGGRRPRRAGRLHGHAAGDGSGEGAAGARADARQPPLHL